MALRSLHQTLIRTSSSSSFSSPSQPNRFVFATANYGCAYAIRTHSNQSGSSSPRLADPDVAESSSDAEQREALAVQRIEDAIHRIIVRRSAPDWLPFVPGSSYWVPPRRRSYGIADLVEKLADTLSDEEVMSLATARGWPSSAFFLSDTGSVLEERSGMISLSEGLRRDLNEL
ncbi:uncharacterized protein LOC127790295 isoform X3 [Diospyros lotus]|uniref:uncharacterized protein LOC127790295 isoform X3 n=1 Tax=Diospyros lotus TaxID=55363 RepID=UPI00225BB742|nr:uncharacterized protein LOC127790295 isoform X3 [Diospyros lotus]